MKKFLGLVVLALVLVFSAFPAFGDIVNPAPVKKELSSAEKITRLGFPSEVATSLTQMIEQGKFVEKVPLKNGIKVSLAIRGSELCQKCSFSWPAHQNSPEREKYVFGEYELFVIKNRKGEIFYRNDLPTAKVTEKATPPKEIPRAEKPLPVTPVPKEIPKTEKSLVAEQKSFAPAPKEITEAEKSIPKYPLKKEKLENVERTVEAYMLKGLHTEELKSIKATAIDFPILGTGWINDGIGKYYAFETEEGEAVERFMTRNLWRAVVTDSSGNYEILPGIKRRCDRVHILYPGAGKDDLLGKHKYLVSGNGKKVLLADGRQVRDFDFEKFQEDETYRIEFLRKYPSEIRAEELLDISPSSKHGEEYVKLLKEQFPNDFYVKGERVSFSSDIQTLQRLNGEMSNANYGHRALKNGALPSLSVSTVIFPVFELGRMAFAALASIPSGPLNGSYEGGKFSGEEIGSTIDLCVLQVLRDYEKQ